MNEGSDGASLHSQELCRYLDGSVQTNGSQFEGQLLNCMTAVD